MRQLLLIKRDTVEYPAGHDLEVAFRQSEWSIAAGHIETGNEYPEKGIYMIRNVSERRARLHWRVRDIIGRWLQHQSALKSGTHDNRQLQEAWDAHGVGVEGVYGFEWIVLEVLPEDSVSWQTRRAIESGMDSDSSGDRPAL